MRMLTVLGAVLAGLVVGGCAATWGTDHFTVHPIGAAAYSFPGATNGVPGHE